MSSRWSGLKRGVRLTGTILAGLIGVLLVSAGILTLSVLGAKRVASLSLPTDSSGWAQAIGAVLAIVVGFAGTAIQLRAQKKNDREKEMAAGRAAYLIAYDAMDTVSDRLAAALMPNRDKKTHALRGSRTSEIVAAMREFDTSRLPDDMLADFVRLRTRVFAINSRITEIYDDEANLTGNELANEKLRRYERLRSAVKVRREAEILFFSLGHTAHFKNGALFENLTAQPLIEAYPPTN